MSPPRILTARAAAWKALNQCDVVRHDTAEVLSGLLGHTDRPGQATDIVFGVIRHRGTIDRILKKCAALDADRVKTSQWNLLRMGVYELLYAPKTADYAILNEAVQLARQAGSVKSGGFINAVLRNVQRAIEDRQAPLDTNHVRRMIPQTSETGCLLNADLLPDPEKEVNAYFGIAYSMPQPLIAAWLNAFGDEQTKAICLASNRSPSVILQPNTLFTTPEDLAEQLETEGVESECADGQVRVRSVGRINQLKAYLEGHFFVQDGTAAAAIKTLAPEPDWTMLDMCAAPGGKCAAAAIRMQDKGLILASDADARRLAKVRENAKRLRLQSIEVVPAARLEPEVRKLKRLDAIVLDVPCSNTGVLARRVEARWRWKAESAKQIGTLQQALLCKAAELARPGTMILYSTCSIQPEENSEQVQAFLKQHNRFTCVAEKLTLPSVRTPGTFDHDGGYAAVLQLK